LLVGVISDTHGFFDPQLDRVFSSVDYILHAGDIGKPEVLDQLERFAPVLAVRGNVDVDARLMELPERRRISLGGAGIQLVHRPQDVESQSGVAAVIFGHTHRRFNEWRENILFLNPGAAGRQGFHRERSVALLEIGSRLSAEIVLLGPRSAKSSALKRSLP
jgi:uncharacterized protein